MKLVNSIVTYFDEDDLFLKSRNKNINDITIWDIKHRELIRECEVVILSMGRGSEQKVLKSRY